MKFYLRNEGDALHTRRIGYILAFIAGALNAGGFLALGRYTSHMTGIVSELSDNIYLNNQPIIIMAVISLASFIAGAITCTIIVNSGKCYRLRSKYALVLFLQGVLVLWFGQMAFNSPSDTLYIMLLCFTMGLQNALMTKISSAVIRTTHITGMITDIGIELGRLIAKRLLPAASHYHITYHPQHLRLHLLIVGFFIAGGISGAFGFGTVSYFYALPLGFLLIALSIPAISYELRVRLRYLLIRRYTRKAGAGGGT